MQSRPEAIILDYTGVITVPLSFSAGLGHLSTDDGKDFVHL